jgi:hypothetical protein
MAPSDWFVRSHIALPLGLCPPVLICLMFKYLQICLMFKYLQICLMFKYLQMADTAPVIDDSSGALLSVLKDIGTPR